MGLPAKALSRMLTAAAGLLVVSLVSCRTTPAPSPSAVRTFTPLSVPTLGNDEATTLLRTLMEGSKTCLLPCWGEMVPGVSSEAQAEKALQPLFAVRYGGPPYSYQGHRYSNAGGGRMFLDENLEISFDAGWLFDQNQRIVERLHIAANAARRLGNGNSEPVYGAALYKQLFAGYSLQSILSKYGSPTRMLAFAYVYEHGNNNPYPNPEEIQILLLYDKGIFVTYTMPLKRISSQKGEACPSDAFFDL